MVYEDDEEDVNELFKRLSHKKRVEWAKQAGQEDWRALRTDTKQAFVESLTDEEQQYILFGPRQARR